MTLPDRIVTFNNRLYAVYGIDSVRVSKAQAVDLDRRIRDKRGLEAKLREARAHGQNLL